MLLGLVILAACGPQTKLIQSAQVGARDGDVWTWDGPIRLALIGHGAQAPANLFEDLAPRPAQMVLLAGDAVVRSDATAWNDVLGRLEGLRVLPMAGKGEREADPRLRGFLASWEGLGVGGLSRPVPWYAVDLHTRGARWRLVVLDADQTALGAQWADQLFWVPKVVGDDGYDHLIVALYGGPGRMDGGAVGGEPAAAELLGLIRRHADATRMVMVVAGGPDAPGVVLPGGRWGEAWVTTGKPVLATAPLWRQVDVHRLAPGYAEALVNVFEGFAGDQLDGLRVSNRFDPATSPVAGFWDLQLDGHEVRLTLKLSARGGWPEAFVTAWSPDGGWSPNSGLSRDSGLSPDR